ncbi:hypothetical protein J437_LFUL017280 [Ladona fulva]|uniref:YEATS domain-containing protein n=1 Tax=Ladona fulva TaxID=123851 RepID=A0A8K0P9E4_LADFU|nr:hypothetical protein J437_LFUL017280 [Ladona fulva]
MTSVLQRVIDNEIKTREKEIESIEGRLSEALRLQHLLRYAVVSSYYGSGTSLSDWPGNFSSKKSMHPAVAGLHKDSPDDERSEGRSEETCVSDSCLSKSEDGTSQVTKVPRYIPPVSKKDPKLTTSPTRGSHCKMKQRIIVGNVSRWIPPESREDGATHKWMIYVRGPANVADLSHLVDKVRFFLHASYRPFDVVEVKSSPYRLSRRGWGEFPIRVQVHFKNSLNKPIDIIHQLKLDKTRSVKDVLGSETIVEIWLHTDKDVPENLAPESQIYEENNGSDEDNSMENDVVIKQEVESESSDQEENDMSSSASPSQEIKAEIKTEECDSHSTTDERIGDCIPGTSQAVNIVKEEKSHASQEDVIEDGCFLMELDNVIDMPSEKDLPTQKSMRIEHRILGAPSNSLLKYQENGRCSVLKLSAKGQLNYIASGINKTQHGVKQIASTAKQGLIKATSLLIKTSNKQPGVSLLLPNAKSSSTLSLLNSKKVPQDPKLSLYTSQMSNLSKRLHSDPCAAARHLLNSLPIISPKASDPAYKMVHPYCADSLSTFLSWPLPKQKASEWMRSRMVRKLLLNQGFSEDVENTWSTRNILQWGRLWGYSPIESKVSSQSNLCCDGGIDNLIVSYDSQISFPGSSFSENKELFEWLNSSQKSTSKDEDDEEEIDVVGSGPYPKRLAGRSKEMGLGAHAAIKPKVTVMGMDPSLGLLSRFVDEKSREVGIVVSGIEELSASIFYPAAQRILVEALRSFVNHIARTSLCIANIRSHGSNDTPLTIEPEDVKLALLEREEFDVFTNEGLGTEPEESSKEVPEKAAT